MAFNLGEWNKVYKLCAEIGQDEISMALSGNKIL
jgi:hypothetical protein